MVDILSLQMLPEEKPSVDRHRCCNGCTCGTGELGSNPFCPNSYTGSLARPGFDDEA
jgi:hypothetical protein